jgi:hypothetical protein
VSSNVGSRERRDSIIVTLEGNRLLSSAAPRLEPTKAISPPAAWTLQCNRSIGPFFVCLLIVVTLGFYNPIAHNGFVLLDDVPYILWQSARASWLPRLHIWS